MKLLLTGVAVPLVNAKTGHSRRSNSRL